MTTRNSVPFSFSRYQSFKSKGKSSGDKPSTSGKQYQEFKMGKIFKHFTRADEVGEGASDALLEDLENDPTVQGAVIDLRDEPREYRNNDDYGKPPQPPEGSGQGGTQQENSGADNITTSHEEAAGDTEIQLSPPQNPEPARESAPLETDQTPETDQITNPEEAAEEGGLVTQATVGPGVAAYKEQNSGRLSAKTAEFWDAAKGFEGSREDWTRRGHGGQHNVANINTDLGNEYYVTEIEYRDGSHAIVTGKIEDMPKVYSGGRN